jgi:hypothetical protein
MGATGRRVVGKVLSVGIIAGALLLAVMVVGRVVRHPQTDDATVMADVINVLVLWAAVARGGQPEPRGPATIEALALCHEADQVPVAERLTVLERGLDRAEEAVRADPQDAVAHFAVFCNLGKRLEMKRRGGGLFATLGAPTSRALLLGT